MSPNSASSKDVIAYHRVPPGWYQRDIVQQHKTLRGSFPIDNANASEPGAPSWMPERHEWLQYRETLLRVCSGVRAGDDACVEIAVRFVVARFIGSYSGYIRERLLRALKSAALDETQKRQLKTHFSSLVAKGVRTCEYPEIFRLWVRLVDEREYQVVLKSLEPFARERYAEAWARLQMRPNISYMDSPSTARA